MLTAHHITKSYDLQTIFEDVSFSLNTGDRVGLIGPNGCGKTTLLRILAGKEEPDSGSVTITYPGLQIGYLPQSLALPPELTLDEAMRCGGDSRNPDKELIRLAEALSKDPNDLDIQHAYDEILEEIQRSAMFPEPQAVLAAFDLDGLPMKHRVGELSGGQKTRLSLARVLLLEPHLLLLDEPTNHLDIVMLEWLEDWLAGFPGGALIVSHDRTFLDRTVNQVLELDKATHQLTQYEGNYSAYTEQKEAERERERRAYDDWKNEVNRLRRAAGRVRSQARFHKGGKGDQGNTDGFSVGHFANRSRKVVGKAKHIEARIEDLLTEERVEKPGMQWSMKLQFDEIKHIGNDALVVQNLTLGYPGQAPLLVEANMVVFGGQRAVLTGPNGCGKTTLLRAIAGQVEYQDGQIKLGANVQLGTMSQEQELLDPVYTALETIQRVKSINEEKARAFLHYFLFSGDAPLRPVATLSFGERARLSLAVLVAQGCNFLLLDEPLNHLDISSREQFEQALVHFNGTILAVVHDRYFIQRFTNNVWEIRNGKLISV